MSLRFAPASAPVAAFLAGVAAASLPVVPVAPVVALGGAGVALGGPAGAGLVAAAAGLLVGIADRPGTPSDDRGRSAEVHGRVCGYWRARPLSGTLSAPLCPSSIVQGRNRLARAPRLWLELPRPGETAGSSTAAPPYGSRVVARGTLSRFPGLANEHEVRPGGWRLRVKSARHLRVVGAPRLFERAAAAIRGRVERAIAAAGDPDRPGVALARAFVLGDESGLGEERSRALRRAGLAHLLAVSGFNVTLLAAIVAIVSSTIPLRGRTAAPALAIALYLAAVGPEPSIVRASWMSAATLGALSLRRPGSAPQALALAAALLVALEPRALADAGFQLSFAATLALVVAGERWAVALDPLPRPLGRALAASLAAQAGTLPWSVAAFAEISPAAPLWNLLAIPWSALWMVAGLVWTLLALAAPPLARSLAPALDLGAWPFGLLERLPPSPLGSLWMPGGWLTGAVLAGIVVAAFELRQRRGAALLGALLLASSPAKARSAAAEATFLDVGQGDAAFVRAGETTLLVDGGGQRGRDLGSSALRPLLARRGISSVDVALLSHADVDHCLGLLELTAHLPIEEVWMPPGATGVECAAMLARRARRAARVLVAGRRLERGEIRALVLHPPPEAGGEGNRASLVVRLDVAGRRLLFVGDLPAAEERRLAAAAAGELAADLLKVSHHGSGGSSDPSFLRAVGARRAVISAGARNGFGHPARSTLARLATAGARVARTDRDGQVTFRWSAGSPMRLELRGSPRRVAAERGPE